MQFSSKLHSLLRSAYSRADKIPRGVRTMVGIPLMILGVFGFLPVLGFLDAAAGRDAGGTGYSSSTSQGAGSIGYR